jgi:NADH-quinone oxidoreductase subunit C
MSEQTEKLIRDSFPDAVLETSDVFGILNVKITAESLVGVCEMLQSKGFDYLADTTAIDWQDRIEVVYQLTALERNEKLALRVDLDRDRPEVDSVVSIWKGADFQEREVYDLMGVTFTGHPDLRRILTPEDWEGFPLRKDYVIPD